MAEDKQQLNTTFADELVKEEIFSESDMAVLRQMVENGVMYGHKKTRSNPKFGQYIFTTRNGIEIIDLAKTLGAIDEVAGFFKSQIAENKKVMIVGLQPASWEAVKKFGEKFNFPTVKNGWVGEWQGEPQLSTGRFGELEVVGGSGNASAPSKESPQEETLDIKEEKIE